MANILIVDDDPVIHGVLSQIFTRLGHSIDNATYMNDGLSLAQSDTFDLVILDLDFPEGNGLDILPQILDAPSQPEVIILTGTGDKNAARLAFDSGAWDYIQKPIEKDVVSLSVSRALQYRVEKIANRKPKRLKREGIIGSSGLIENCLDQVAQAAATNTNVLITGETGTGKELFAWAIHDNSGRSGNNFVVVDCTVLPQSLVESTLFGHEKGAFTGADTARDGLIRQSHCGTLFLDEVGELPLDTQTSFLRVLQEKRFRPVGAKHEINCDFRLVAATNQDLEDLVRKGRFRADLLYRLRTLTIQLPALRKNKVDIKELLHYYLAGMGEEHGVGTKGFSPEFEQALISYDWPGNIRELVHCLERAMAVSGDEPTLYPKHLPTDIRAQFVRERASVGSTQSKPVHVVLEDADSFPTFKAFRISEISKSERGYLTELMRRANGNRETACNLSGLSVPRLYALLKKHNLSKFRNK